METPKVISIDGIEYVRKDSITLPEVRKDSITLPEVSKDLVMIRTHSAGVHFGTLKNREGKEVTLTNAYRVHYWGNACSLSQLAMQGSQGKGKENRISIPVPEIILTEAVEIIPMTEEAFKDLTSKLWKM